MFKENKKNDFNILVIDDCIDFNNTLSEKFSNISCSVYQAYNAIDSIEIVKEYTNQLNLIILCIDIKHDNLNSFIKEIEDLSDAKIIILSNYEEVHQREEYFKYGILDYHLKSNNIEYIFSDICELMKRLEYNKNENILLIDDSKVVRYVIKSLLDVRNYNVITAKNAKDGIEIIKNNKISLLLLDMELPDMHGIEVLEKLRELYVINTFPTLILSGSSNPSIVRQALKKGSSDFLRKPFMFEEFLLKIDLWIKTSKWQREFKGQKKQIEESLKSFEALVDSTMEALFIFEKDCCLDLNNEAVALIGYRKKDEVLGKGIFEIFNDVTNEHKAELSDEKTDHFFEDVLVNTEGKRIQVQFKEKNILTAGKILKIIAVMDITQIKQKEQILNNQSKMASMGEMIGNIAHQWRQPLTAISVAAGGIKLNYELDMEERDETIKELDNIVNNTQFLSSTIEDFQNFLKDNREIVVYSLKETVEKTISIIKANLESYEINIIKNYNQNIQIKGIQNDLIQVLLNIINNAGDILKTIKNPEQKKYIIIDINQTDENINIQIQDSAGGVPSEIIDKIFEPYFTTKHQSQGTGLGLYMTHQIIHNMGGIIEVENSSFQYNADSYYGAKFNIILPIN
ncbi:MAG: response regulator [Campylobacterota bacterium]|nr:response regulator [Campylobacterota bacterium]